MLYFYASKKFHVPRLAPSYLKKIETHVSSIRPCTKWDYNMAAKQMNASASAYDLWEPSCSSLCCASMALYHSTLGGDHPEEKGTALAKCRSNLATIRKHAAH